MSLLLPCRRMMRSFALSFVACLLAQTPAARADLLVSTDFTAPPPAQVVAYGSSAPQDGDVTAKQAITDDGTIDTYQGRPTRAMTLTADFTKGLRTAKAGVIIGRFPVANKEADLAKLTVGFDLWIDNLRPVRVYVQSCDASGRVSGALTAMVTLPAAGTFYRFTLDLSAMKPAPGRFDPLAPQIQFCFELNNADDPASPAANAGARILRIDNLSYASPACYVSPKGSDGYDGRSEKRPFATIQKAIDAARPGDVILLLGGTYRGAPDRRLAVFSQAAAPDKWIVLRSAPGQKAVLQGDAFDIVFLQKQAAYIELRDLTVQGDTPKLKLADAKANATEKTTDGKHVVAKAVFNTNGISVNGRSVPENARPHHLRFIHNTIFDCPGAGITAISSDHVVIEGNVVADNCHLMRYGGSGISTLTPWNFDGDTGYKTFVIGNVSHGNRTDVPCYTVDKITDGNGIIIDINKKSADGLTPYLGRTLVQNNLVYGNGGSGIHAFGANHVDIINNTAYHNAQSPDLVWRQIFAASQSTDIHVSNNIMWAQKGRPTHFKIGYQNSDISYDHNLVFGDGDNEGPESGGLGTDRSYASVAKTDGNIFKNPGFVNPSLDPKTADFRLRPDSPAIDQALAETHGVPRNDLRGVLRPVGPAPDIGAYEFTR